jgi:hypothetical protein
MARNKELIKVAIKVAENEPIKIPMIICLTMGHSTHSLA